MNAKYTILIAIVAIAIIYRLSSSIHLRWVQIRCNPHQPQHLLFHQPQVQLQRQQPHLPQPTAHPTAHPTTNPTANPTATPAPTASPSPTPVPVPASLTGAGATFPYPLINAMITNYTAAKPYIQVNYQSIGSGGGISAMQQKTVDFGASDAPLSATEMNNIPNALHIPETIGAVTVAYNLPGIATGLHLTGQVIADIYQGTITMWNDPAIQNLNPTITLPAKTIVVVHRSDGSGTSFVFTGYLTASSSAWNTAVGQGKAVAWPTGLGASGNAGVAGTVEGTAYTIGYVELAYSIAEHHEGCRSSKPHWKLDYANTCLNNSCCTSSRFSRFTIRWCKLDKRKHTQRTSLKRISNS